MYFTACPFCHLEVPSSELQWHANNHFEDEQEQQRLAADSELAHQLAFAPPSPPPYFRESSTSNSGNNIHQKISNCSIDLQKRGVFRRIEGGLMALLKNCLESEPENTTSILSGYVDHFQSTESEDVGWGCGWRNIQMLSSHLLVRRPEAREVLFGGLGFVPDIPSLQRWLE
ncbi:zinc finger with UFM1-specific peptidase domain protein-like, partial [Morus notabilis]|uniref:zinc finger with UFM1-specific peptidase domain protein-like n=1 Tax=Morus notabilis TaxID=981085 RepID=UPI000CED2331